MRLDQKYFIPFMIVAALFTILAIIITSFSFNEKRQERFKENLVASDSLLSKKMPIVGEADSLSMQSQAGNPSLLVFWASWSDKSVEMLEEIQNYQNENKNLGVVAALVKDAEESLPARKKFPTFIYVDGTQLFNDLKVPGYPSYILFDESGEVLHAQIGYKDGTVQKPLRKYLN